MVIGVIKYTCLAEYYYLVDIKPFASRCCKVRLIENLILLHKVLLDCYQLAEWKANSPGSVGLFQANLAALARRFKYFFYSKSQLSERMIQF